MPVTIDNVSNGGSSAGLAAIVWNHVTSPGLTNSVFGSDGTTGQTTAAPLTGISYGTVGGAGGTALTAITNINETNNNCNVSCWLLKNPASGTKEVTATQAASHEITAGGYSAQFVNQTTPVNPAGPHTNTGGVVGTTASVVVTTGVNELAISAMVENGGSNVTLGGGQTVIHNSNIGSGAHTGASSYMSGGSGTVTPAYNALTTGNTWAIIGYSLQFDAGGGVAAIPGKTIQSQYNEPEDRSFFSSSKLTKPQPGGAAPQGASKLGKVFQSQFNDILGYDFTSSSKQTKGQPGGAAPPGATILGKSFVNNPAPNPETEWDYANGVFAGSASPGVASTPNVPNLIPKVNANPLFVDYKDFTLYQSKVIRGQPGVPPVIGLPRHSIINPTSCAAQIIDDDSMFISRFGVKASRPAKGTIPAPPVTNVISGAGLVGAGTMRGN